MILFNFLQSPLLTFSLFPILTRINIKFLAPEAEIFSVYFTFILKLFLELLQNVKFEKELISWI